MPLCRADQTPTPCCGVQRALCARINGAGLVIFIAMLIIALPTGNRGYAQTSTRANIQANTQANGSGLAIPRFVSLKSDRVNIRGGPGTDYRILWVFRRAGLPVEVLKEYQGWRQIRDAEGGTGWVFGALLSGRRTALVLPWERGKSAGERAQLQAGSSADARTLALLQSGVLTSLIKCTGQWCKVSVGDIRGFIEQKKLWGVYPREQLK